MMLEGFLELVEEAFKKNMDVSICSNGFKSEKLLKKLREENRKIYIQVSLDGPKGIHNRIRGSDTAYDDAMNLILNGRRDGHRVEIATTVSSENFIYLESICKELAKEKLFCCFVFIRSSDQIGKEIDFIPNKKNDLSISQMRECYRIWKKYNAPYMGQLDRAIITIDFEEEMSFFQRGRWSYKCAAGVADAVLYPNGEVSVCEMAAPVGNILDHNLDWAEFWRHHPQKLKNCACQLCPAIINSIAHSPRGLVSLVRRYITQLKWTAPLINWRGDTGSS
jgi:MoaA/NifB/PqqE/SkfB family radical SAM enzyme